MDIDAKWHKPIDLVPAEAFGYNVDLDAFPTEAGVYVFGRTWGDNSHPLYIGQSINLRARIKQHLDSVNLMKAIAEAASGQRFVMVCTLNLKRGQQVDRVLGILERGLIDRALTEGHELINVHGTKTPTHSVSFQGNRTSEQISGRYIYVRVT
ncbi:MAG: hypothetical protein AB7U75_02190 [Hyphomicrobiaceae bacterium]